MAADLVLRAVDDTRINRAALTLLRLHYVEFLTGWIDTDKELPDEDVTAARAWLDEMSAHCGYVEVSPVSFGKARGINDPQWIPGPVAGIMRVFGDEYTPRAITRGFAKDALAAMNVADHSHYRTWTRGGKVCPRRRVKRFFEENEGRLAFAGID